MFGRFHAVGTIDVYPGGAAGDAVEAGFELIHVEVVGVVRSVVRRFRGLLGRDGLRHGEGLDIEDAFRGVGQADTADGGFRVASGQVGLCQCRGIFIGRDAVGTEGDVGVGDAYPVVSFHDTASGIRFADDERGVAGGGDLEAAAFLERHADGFRIGVIFAVVLECFGYGHDNSPRLVVGGVFDASVVRPVGHQDIGVEVVGVGLGDGDGVAVVVCNVEPGGVAVGRRLREGYLIGYVLHFRFVYFVFTVKNEECLVLPGAGISVESACAKSVVGIVAVEGMHRVGDELIRFCLRQVAVYADGEKARSAASVAHRDSLDGEAGISRFVVDIEACD
ncbi:hypothetical protein, partial [Parabacteroides goldsteinii]|uniref:hypothetical protein n=1 Tax=Parabacteroides goldsteinii TaxID=328812 RepID=UPI00128BAE07